MIVGRTVNLKLINGENEVDVIAKVDTGAYSSSIDSSIAVKLDLKSDPIKKKITSASGESERDFYKILISDNNMTTEAMVNIAARDSLKYKMILGRKDISKLNYIVDVNKP